MDLPNREGVEGGGWRVVGCGTYGVGKMGKWWCVVGGGILGCNATEIISTDLPYKS